MDVMGMIATLLPPVVRGERLRRLAAGMLHATAEGSRQAQRYKEAVVAEAKVMGQKEPLTQWLRRYGDGIELTEIEDWEIGLMGESESVVVVEAAQSFGEATLVEDASRIVVYDVVVRIPRDNAKREQVMSAVRRKLMAGVAARAELY